MSPARDGSQLPAEMGDLLRALFPLCRSITGNGVRETLAILGRYLPLEVHEVPTGTPVLDWTVPREWNIADAYIADLGGRRVVDFQKSNLHVLGYSTPIRERLTRAELEPHLFSLPDRPDAVPYRTSYYRETWGFCLSERQRAALMDDAYDVRIDATLADGALTYGECVVPGETSSEVLLSTHVCHPSLANDNLSGLALLALLGGELAAGPRPWFTYRLLFVPSTIGAITWLARNREAVGNIRHGLVLTGLGGPGPLTYKRSRRGDTATDRIAEFVVRALDDDADVRDFDPYGYDERQYCSPGFDLPVGRLSRAPHGEYPEYHTSEDNLEFVDSAALEGSYTALARILHVFEHDRRYRNLQPYGEPQLGRRGLYRSVGASIDSGAAELELLWVLSLSDGTHSLLDIAERSGLSFDSVVNAAQALEGVELLAPTDDRRE